jgi:EmrB/QacA subfamily drug resistance transporter
MRSEGERTDRLDTSTLLALGAMGVAVLVVANDFTALSVALPAIEHRFGSDVSSVQWVINAYALVFGVLIVTGGRLSDLFGRRRMFFVGATVFATFSLAGGLATTLPWLVGCRAIMGVGGALMWPAILGMTYALLPSSKAGLAGGLILGAAGLGNAIGPLIGGALTDSVGWRWIFFLNVPVAAVAIVVTWLLVRAPRAAEVEDRSIDVTGITVLSIGLLALLVGLDQGSTDGWTDPWILGLFVLGIVALAAFGAVERRAGRRALIPPDVMSNRGFASAGLTVLLMSAIFFATLLYLPQFMTKELGYGALGSGLGLLPMMGTFAVVSFAAGPLYGRLGPKRTVSAGAILLTLGIGVLATTIGADSYPALLPGMFVLGAGVGLFYSSVTTAGVTALDPARASLAGGIIYMFQIAGGSIGLGLNTAIVTSQGSLPDGIRLAFGFDAVLAACGVGVSLLFIGGEPSIVQANHRPWLHRAHA